MINKAEQKKNTQTVIVTPLSLRIHMHAPARNPLLLCIQIVIFEPEKCKKEKKTKYTLNLRYYLYPEFPFIYLPHIREFSLFFKSHFLMQITSFFFAQHFLGFLCFQRNFQVIQLEFLHI